MTNSMQTTLLGAMLLGTLSVALACDPGEPEPGEGRSAALEPANEVDEGAPARASGSLEDQLLSLQPQETRAGFLRFGSPLIHSPEAASVLHARLDAATDPPEVRAALAEALSRTGADYAAAVSERIPHEADARVREVLVGTLGRRVDNADAHPGLRAGLQDAEAAVRSQAARVVASRADGAEFADALILLLDDSDVDVRVHAARSLGVLEVESAREALAGLLDHADAKLRLNSLRALSRIDPATLATVDLERLGQDEDQRVSRLANKLRTD